jgi:hypothetical protein
VITFHHIAPEGNWVEGGIASPSRCSGLTGKNRLAITNTPSRLPQLQGNFGEENGIGAAPLCLYKKNNFGMWYQTFSATRSLKTSFGLL